MNRTLGEQQEDLAKAKSAAEQNEARLEKLRMMSEDDNAEIILDDEETDMFDELDMHITEPTASSTAKKGGAAKSESPASKNAPDSDTPRSSRGEASLTLSEKKIMGKRNLGLGPFKIKEINSHELRQSWSTYCEELLNIIELFPTFTERQRRVHFWCELGSEMQEFCRSMQLTSSMEPEHIITRIADNFDKMVDKSAYARDFELIKQEEKESALLFSIRLLKAAKFAGHERNEDTIKYKFLNGLRIKDLRENPLAANLPMQQLVSTASNIEATKSQEAQTVSAINGNGKRWNNSKGGNYRKKYKSSPNTSARQNDEKKCEKCGWEQHKEGKICPASKAECRTCGNKGHFQKVCRQAKNEKAVNKVQEVLE